MTHACKKDNLQSAMCKFWECHNAYCPNYAGHGVLLGILEIEWDVFGQHSCRRCGAFVRESRAAEAPWARAVAWTALGVILSLWAGWDFVGVILGAAAGLLLCLLAELRGS